MTAQTNAASPDISVVVCTRNRAALLRGALASLYDLATEDEFTYEIVVVDSGSTDETPQVIAAAMQESKHPLRVFLERESGIAAARKLGIAAARGRWIAFFDDDQLADWHWLAELFRGAQEKNSRVVGGSVQLALPADCKRQLDPAVQMVLGESMGADLPQKFGGRLAPGGGNLMLERAVLDEVGHSKTATRGREEDAGLYYRVEQAKIDAWFIPTAIVHRLTPAERLEQDSLLRLSRLSGHGEAIRLWTARGAVRFAWIWLTRYLHLWTVQYPAWFWARLRSDNERTLGRSCELAIAHGFLRGANRTEESEERTARQGVRPAPEACDAGTRRAAPVYILRSGEPTAVMDVSQLALNMSPPKLPSR